MVPLSTKVVASPSSALLRLNDPGDPTIPRISDENPVDSLHAVSYPDGTYDVVAAQHSSVDAEADSEVGYGRLIGDPWRGENLYEGRNHPAYPVGGRVGEAHWLGLHREQFRTALLDARAVADHGTAALDAVLPKHRAALTKALADAGLEWETPDRLIT